MQFITSWDDGSEHDIRLARLLKKYGFIGIFYIPTCCQLEDRGIQLLSDLGMEIGGHTTTHPLDMKKLNYEQALDEMISNRHWLQQLTGQSVFSFAYPRGRHNEVTRQAAKDAGFSEARTTLVGHLNSVDPFQTLTTVHVHPSRKEYDGKNWTTLAKQFLLKAGPNDTFHLWGHSEEIDRYNLWDELEMFLQFAYENIRTSKN